MPFLFQWGCPVLSPLPRTNNRPNFNADETGVLLQASRRNTSVSCALQLCHLPGLSPKLRLHCLPEADPPIPSDTPPLPELRVLCND